MAKHADVNATGDNPTGMFKLKEVLKLAGFTIESSGTGTGFAYSSSGDIITHAGSGAGGMNNTGSWWRARDPSGLREYVAQCSSAQVRFLYSKSARFTGGTPGVNRVPTATDQQILYGGGTDAAPTYAFMPNHTANTYRFHIVAIDTPVGGVYPWYFTCSTTPGGVVGQGTMACEPMAPGSYDVADPDPCVHFSTITSLLSNPSPFFWLGGSFVTGIMDPIISAGSLSADIHSGKDTNVRPMYTTNPVTRIKGWGGFMAVKGSGRAYPATANTAVDAFAYFGNFCLPYPDNTPPNGA